MATVPPWLRAQVLGLSSASAEGRQPGERDDTPSRPITFRVAEGLDPFKLAQLWSDRTAWPLDERTQYDELSELAVMSALATRLRRWQPIAMHGAILAGASPEAVAGALGDTLEAAFDATAVGERFLGDVDHPGYAGVTRRKQRACWGGSGNWTDHARAPPDGIT
jgi:hypothetical protein